VSGSIDTVGTGEFVEPSEDHLQGDSPCEGHREICRNRFAAVRRGPGMTLVGPSDIVDALSKPLEYQIYLT
jgi:hypothetical protein